MYVLGNYKLKEARRFIAGGCSFELSSGAVVSVLQEDKKYNKVLISFDDRTVDWYHKSLLDLFTNINEVS